MNKNLKRVRFRAKDEHGKQLSVISATSLVTEPAIERNFQLFSAVPTQKQVFKVTSEERQEICGPAMVPNIDILRKDENGEFYYCYFTEQDVEDFAELFLSENFHQSANFEHGTYFTKDIAVKESWIVTDPAIDKSQALGFKDVSKGDWFITYKCHNPELWSMIKKTGLAGFSVEVEINKFSEQELEQDIEDLVDELLLPLDSRQQAIADITNFHSFVTVGELTFGDYPQGAVDNAVRALEWRKTNLDKECGNALLWKRASLIAQRKPLAYSLLKRISLNTKLEARANLNTYESGCAAIAYDALGGGDLLQWSKDRLSRIDALVKEEAAKVEKPLLEKNGTLRNPFYLK